MSSAYRSFDAYHTAREAEISTVRWRLGFAGILILTAILFFARLGTRALWSSEFRWAEIAREMIATHNYFWPTINGRVYYDKPLGSYWLVVLSTYVTGGMNEAAARLPCALTGILGVALVMLLAKRLYDSRTALFSGMILATSFSFVFFSRHASADVETVTGNLAALMLFKCNEDRPNGWWVVGLWVIMAITSLMKGLLGFVLPLITIGTYVLLCDGWSELLEHLRSGSPASRVRWVIDRNRWLFNWKSVLAIALAVAIYYAPFLQSHAAAGSEKGLRMVWRENVVRFFRPFDHRGPIYLYVYVIFALMAPWAIFLPAALLEIHQRRRSGEEPARSDRFALVYFWATFIFFSLSGSRRSYYLLPILPAAAIIVARILSRREFKSVWASRLFKISFGAIAVVVLIGIVFLLPPSWLLPGKLANLPAAPHPMIFAVGWACSAATVIYALRRYRPSRAGISIATLAYAAMVYIFLFAMPAADAYRGEKPFASQTLSKLYGNLDHLGYYRTQESLFYLNPARPLVQFEKAADLRKAIQAEAIDWIIVRRKDVGAIDMPNEIVLEEPSYAWEDKHDLQNKVALVRIIRPSSQTSPQPR